jgi:hypothetical protein
MRPVRQIEAAQLMIAMYKYTISYAQSLVAATPDAMLLRPKKKIGDLTAQQVSLMEQESATLDRDFKTLEQDYGTDHLDLVLSSGYATKLPGNAKIVRFLAQFYPDMLAEFQKISETRKAA